VIRVRGMIRGERSVEEMKTPRAAKGKKGEGKDKLPS